MKVVKLIILLSITLFSFSTLSASTPIVNAKVKFYSTTLDLRFDPEMGSKNKHCTSHACVKRFYTKLEKSNFQILLDDLMEYKEKLQLNDWFFYNLVRKTSEHIYKDKSGMFQTSVTWFLMTKAGYDTRLYTAQSKYTFLYVRTEDTVFEAPFVKIKGKPYINLTSVYHSIDTRRIYFEIPRYQPGQLNNKPFSFKIEKFPILPPASVHKTYDFSLNKEKISIEVEIDTIGASLLKRFPITKPINYIKVPLSNTTMASLKKALQPHLQGKSPADQVRVLVSFTRKAFPYKSDQVRFQRDQPLTADQLMLADSSDFEDRCAMLHTLLKEMTDLNFILVQYIHDDIITIGVDLPEIIGKPFEHEGIKYTICDPTMPSNSSKLGLYPISLDKDIEILEVYNKKE